MLVVVLASCGAAPVRPPASAGLAWNEWSPEAFERARRERRIVMLSVQAGWCHWCHVMNDVTFQDPAVQAILGERFLLVRADGDARPDLATRYARYAWPATVFLDPDGQHVVGLRGYRPPARFRAILGEVLTAVAEGRAIADDEPADEPAHPDLVQARDAVRAQLDAMYDEDDGGWGQQQRYPFTAPVEHALFRAAVHGEDRWRERALFTLERYAMLIDPVWGGMYQYSEGGVWDRPHFEKIAAVQAGSIGAFADAYAASGDRAWLERAEAVRRYVRAFLTSPEGAFYTSQDADLSEPHVPGPEYYARDDASRRALGIPRVDRHVYASHNGMLIAALARLAMASGESAPLREATAAAEHVLDTHRHATGLYVHDADASETLLHLADQSQLLAGMIALHQASGRAIWLAHARALADAMLGALRDPATGGFFAHTEDPHATGVFRERQVPIRDNAIAARALLALARLTDDERYAEAARSALAACARPGELRSLGRIVGEYLLALELALSGHVLLTVVGPDEPRTRALHRAALSVDEPTKLVELSRPGESRYADPGEPAVFLCTHEACSMPITDPSALPRTLRRFLSRD
jgi:uncharacterized protein YyaL (SSP411 family)